MTLRAGAPRAFNDAFMNPRDIDVPDLDEARDRQERQPGVHRPVAGLHQYHEPAAVNAVGEDAAERREDEDGNPAHHSGEP